MLCCDVYKQFLITFFFNKKYIPHFFRPLTFLSVEEPDSPSIISSASEIQATSLIVKWTAPADDGGSPITAYRVVILKTGTEIKNENITDPGTTSLSVGGLERDTEYNVRVFGRNFVFEGPAGEKTLKTKYEGTKMRCLVLRIFRIFWSILPLY